MVTYILAVINFRFREYDIETRINVDTKKAEGKLRSRSVSHSAFVPGAGIEPAHFDTLSATRPPIPRF